MTALTEVRLHGELGARFGREHRYAVGSAREAVAALVATVPGFERYMLDNSLPGYHLFIGDQDGQALTESQLDDPVSSRERISIVPAIAGAKDGSTQAIIGIVLVVATFMSAGTTTPYLSAFLSAYGYQLGAALILGGIVQMLTPSAKSNAAVRDEGSNNFGDVLATDSNGQPVPLTVGRSFVVGLPISSALLTEQIAIPVPYVPMPPAEQPYDGGGSGPGGEGGEG